jgi:hypothetical protein
MLFAIGKNYDIVACRFNVFYVYRLNEVKPTTFLTGSSLACPLVLCCTSTGFAGLM